MKLKVLQHYGSTIDTERTLRSSIGQPDHSHLQGYFGGIVVYIMVLSRVIRAASRVSRSCAVCSRRAAYSTDSKGRYFTKKHEWVTVKDNIGTVGISNYAQDALGEVVYVQLPEVGAAVAAGDECGALESVKAASEVYTPVSGTITEKNTAVEETPALINQSCTGDGWLFRVRLSKPEELNALMDQTSYDKYLEEDH